MIATNAERSTQDLIDRLDWLRAQRVKARTRAATWTRRADLITTEVVVIERLLVTRGIVDHKTTLDQHILELVADGKTNPEIAEVLGFSTDYIKQRIDVLLEETGVSSRTALVAHHFRTGRLK